MSDLKGDLVKAAEAYCAASGMSLARLATIVANDGKFFTRLAGGGGLTIKMYERFMTYLATNPPANASSSTSGDTERAA